MSPAPPVLTDAKRRLVERLKRVETATVPELAAAMELTSAAIRQHLDALAASGLVETAPASAAPRSPNGPDAPRGRGRPAARFRLTPLAADLFPDRHADLTVELIGAIREAVGEDGLDAVLAIRADRQKAAYDHTVNGTRGGDSGRPPSLATRVKRLAAVRSAEGYVAEADRDGRSIILTEHHCPVCEAATACQGLCRNELDLFRGVLGDGVTVERTAHLLSGDTRCTYRISPKV